MQLTKILVLYSLVAEQVNFSIQIYLKSINDKGKISQSVSSLSIRRKVLLIGECSYCGGRYNMVNFLFLRAVLHFNKFTLKLQIN